VQQPKLSVKCFSTLATAAATALTDSPIRAFSFSSQKKKKKKVSVD
jgi:hypothetical protein